MKGSPLVARKEEGWSIIFNNKIIKIKLKLTIKNNNFLNKINKIIKVSFKILLKINN